MANDEPTPLNLDAIKARAERATPGPWETEKPGPFIHTVWHPSPGAPRDEVARFMSPADARFVTHARTDIPLLVAEVERLRSLTVSPGRGSPIPPAVSTCSTVGHGQLDAFALVVLGEAHHCEGPDGECMGHWYCEECAGLLSRGDDKIVHLA